MAYDFQSEFDTMFFGEDSLFSEEISGTPSGGSEITLYADVRRVGSELARMKGGYESSIKQTVVVVSKTDWPTVTKNADRFTIPMNGVDTIMKVVAVIGEDSVSYTLAVA